MLCSATRTPESFAGWVARNPISAGEPLSETKIIAPGNRGFLAAVLRPGMRAILGSGDDHFGDFRLHFPGRSGGSDDHPSNPDRHTPVAIRAAMSTRPPRPCCMMSG